jgi:heptosyltransferase-2
MVRRLGGSAVRRFDDTQQSHGVFTTHQPPNRQTAQPTLVIQTAHLGDVVLTLPLLIRLAERTGPVDVVTTPPAASLVASHPAVRRVIPFDKRHRDRGAGGLFRLARVLRGTGYRQALLVQGSLRSAALAALARIPSRIGFAGEPGVLLCSERVPRPQSGPMASRLLALAGGGTLPETPWIALSAQDRLAADAWLSGAGIHQPFVALAPGARWYTKRWLGFAELAARLEWPMAVIGGAEDRLAAEEIVAAAGGRARSAAGVLDLRGSAAVIERASLLVTNDSLALHLATALARPIVAVFGPTSPAFGFGPLQPEDRVVEHPALPCRPCSAHGPAICPLGHHRCMRDVGVEPVLQAVHDRLETGVRRP